MARDEDASLLMNLPLEVRHTIFDHLSVRAMKPKMLLRRWYEKEETEKLISEYLLDDPDAPTPVAVYSDGGYDTQGESDTAEEGEGEEQEEQNNEGNKDEDEDEDGETSDDNDNTDHPSPRSVIVLRKQWRHIPKLLRLTHCPPPLELLLTSRQLHIEAIDWFYNVAVLRIDATASFAHTSFFEEALDQLAGAEFSPLENIRKVQVTFVWDSTWIRADTTGYVEAIFPALLRKRASFVYKVLARCKKRREIVIHWHDSAQDSESAMLMADVLKPFKDLFATTKIVEHYVAADAKPKERSIAGKRRLEFEEILQLGLQSLS